jgi:hypothetical protein
MKRKTSDNQKENVEKAQDRAAVWRRAQGMWKDRQPDPIMELNKIREEWEERLKEQEKIWRTKQRGDQAEG